MLVIRAAQMAAFRSAGRRPFVDEVTEIARRCLPDRAAASPEDELRAAIERGIDRAEAYQITAKPEVCQFVCATLALGEDFDIDPARPWAAPILTSALPPADKIKWLFAGLHAETGGPVV